MVFILGSRAWLWLAHDSDLFRRAELRGQLLTTIRRPHMVDDVLGDLSGDPVAHPVDIM